MLHEFLGWNGYTRDPEGFLSWQHLTFVTALMVCMVLLAVLLGLRSRGQSSRRHNRVLAVSAILMDALELFKILLLCIMENNYLTWLHHLPLYMCSIQMITLPLAAFARGRVKEAATDFVCIFGVIGALLGTYGAGQNYASYPVLSLNNVVSGLTHSIAGFASLYIMIVGIAGMQKRNVHITCGIILAFSAAAYVFNALLGSNYMFLVRGDGTPYDIVYHLVSGHAVLYPLCVVALFILYILLFYVVFWRIRSQRNASQAQVGSGRG